jgi:hypothetical protein
LSLPHRNALDYAFVIVKIGSGGATQPDSRLGIKGDYMMKCIVCHFHCAGAEARHRQPAKEAIQSGSAAEF